MAQRPTQVDYTSAMKRLLKSKSKVTDTDDDAPRDGRKQRTRRALMDAALTLLEGERSFSSLSLREVAKVGAWFQPRFTGTSAAWRTSGWHWSTMPSRHCTR